MITLDSRVTFIRESRSYGEGNPINLSEADMRWNKAIGKKKNLDFKKGTVVTKEKKPT